MPTDVLSKRALNRALLARQMLLQREKLPAADAIERLVGMQAQVPRDPYYGLWTRLAGFQPDELAQMIAERAAVRVSLLRTTIHLVTARDCLALRAIFQGVLERGLWSGSPFGRQIKGVDVDELLGRVGRCWRRSPARQRSSVRSCASAGPTAMPTRSPTRCGTCCPSSRCRRAALWTTSGQPVWTTAEAWLGGPLGEDTSPDDAVMRYLAAFGPATVGDIRTWSWLTGLREVVERLRTRLRTFRDERGRELFDVPDGLLPDPETPAPPRFLPEYDNVLLSHDDRSRIVSDEDRKRFYVIGGRSVLIDGFVGAKWKLEREGRRATLIVEPFAPLSAADRMAVAEEGARLLAFAGADAQDHDSQWA